MQIKPMLACDAKLDKIKFPCIIQPKIDGVRGRNFGNGLTGRSLKKHANIYTTMVFSDPDYEGFDGELVAGSNTDPNLCRMTTSALSTIAGEPHIVMNVFDYITPETIHLQYQERLEHARQKLDILHQQQRAKMAVIIHPSLPCMDMKTLEEREAIWLDQGYEGVIIRDPYGLYKQGRSTVREGGLLRIKRFVEEEAVVVEIKEGQSNNNVATVGLLGQTERSTHKENMIPNGMVGTLVCRTVKSGELIDVAPGKMDHGDRKYYFEHPELIVGRVIKFKHFPIGKKDKPRFPTFQSIRMGSDIG